MTLHACHFCADDCTGRYPYRFACVAGFLCQTCGGGLDAVIAAWANREREAAEPNPWLEYERRKADIAREAKSPQEYEQRLAELAEELGV